MASWIPVLWVTVTTCVNMSEQIRPGQDDMLAHQVHNL